MPAGGAGTSTGGSTQYDRQLYLSSTGAVIFGVYSSSPRVVTSPSTTYDDGAWHFAAATPSPAGRALYLHGKPVASGAASTAAEVFSGYWRVGSDTIGAAAGCSASGYSAGQLRYAAVYTSALSAAQVATHWGAGRGT